MADINAFKGIIFDLDETLLNTLEVYWAAFNRGIGDFGLKPLEKQGNRSLFRQRDEAGRRCLSRYLRSFSLRKKNELPVRKVSVNGTAKSGH